MILMRHEWKINRGILAKSYRTGAPLASVQLPRKVAEFETFIYGRYKELVHGVYNSLSANLSVGGPILYNVGAPTFKLLHNSI